MNIFHKFVLSISLLTLSGLSHSACNAINGSGEITLNENNFINDKACIVISDLTINNTVIVGDAQLPGETTQNYVGYGINVQPPHQNLQQFRITDKTEFAKLVVDNTAQIQLEIVKKPENAHLKHSFSIAVNKENFGITVIHIKPNAIDENFIATPPVQPGPVCNDIYTCVYPDSLPGQSSFENFNDTESSAFTNSSAVPSMFSQQEAAQCNANNRPPSAPPGLRTNNNIKLNLNDVLRKESAFNTNATLKSFIQNTANPTQAIMMRQAIIFTHLYSNHRNGAIYDVKSKNSIYAGDADYGNYLFGAVMAVYGFNESETQRYSAAYQAMQNYGKFLGFVPGIYNWMTNTGDSPGDKEMVTQGHKYAKEVFSQNKSDVQSNSCLDPVTQHQIYSALQQGGGGEGYGLPGMNGTTQVKFRVTCELWSLPDGDNGYYFMWRNCTVTLEP